MQWRQNAIRHRSQTSSCSGSVSIRSASMTVMLFRVSMRTYRSISSTTSEAMGHRQDHEHDRPEHGHGQEQDDVAEPPADRHKGAMKGFVWAISDAFLGFVWAKGRSRGCDLLRLLAPMRHRSPSRLAAMARQESANVGLGTNEGG